MRHHSLPVLLGVGAAGLVCGLGLGRFASPGTPVQPWPPTEPSAGARASARQIANESFTEGGVVHRGSAATIPARPGPGKKPSFSAEEWLGQALSLDKNKLDRDKVNQLVQALNEDLTLRQELIRQYEATTSTKVKELLADALGASPSPEVSSLSLRLIESGDKTRQRHGLQLLASMPATPETHQTVRRFLGSEQDPALLKQAVAAMQPSMLIEPTEMQSTVSQLSRLTAHPDPAVGATSLEMLALWDKTGKATEAAISQALAHDAPEVKRQAALNAVMTGQLRSDGIKTTLMSLLGNVNEAPEIRKGAFQALANFPLNNDEFAAYHKARAEIEPLRP